MATDPVDIIDPPAGDPPADPAAPPPANDAPSDPPADAPDWRARMAGEDKDLLGFLGRYTSEDAAVKAWKKDRDDIRSGKLRRPLGDAPSDDELAAYRRDYGVPDKPEGYLEKLSDGLIVGPDDQPFVAPYLDVMHKHNVPAGAASALVAHFIEEAKQGEAQHADAVDAYRKENDILLHEALGPDYRRTLNTAKSYLDTVPPEVKAFFADGVDAKTGMPGGLNAGIVQWLANVALDKNPLHSIVPGAGGNQAGAIDDEIASIEKRMSTDRKGYNADEKQQARYRDLINARLSLKK